MLLTDLHLKGRFLGSKGSETAKIHDFFYFEPPNRDFWTFRVLVGKIATHKGMLRQELLTISIRNDRTPHTAILDLRGPSSVAAK